MAQRDVCEADLDSASRSSGFPRLDPLLSELAWEDISELAHAYFVDDPTGSGEADTPEQPVAEAVELFNSKPPSASVQPYSSHFAYQNKKLSWDPTPFAPETARTEFNSGLTHNGLTQPIRQETGSGSLSHNALPQSSTEHLELPDPQACQQRAPEPQQAQQQRTSEPEQAQQRKTPDTQQAEQQSVPSYQHHMSVDRKAAVNRLAQKTYRTKQKVLP